MEGPSSRIHDFRITLEVYTVIKHAKIIIHRFEPEKKTRGSNICTETIPPREIYTDPRHQRSQPPSPQDRLVLAGDEGGSLLGVLGHRVAVHVAVRAAGAERVALVAVRLDLGGVLVEQREAVAVLVAGEDLGRSAGWRGREPS